MSGRFIKSGVLYFTGALYECTKRIQVSLHSLVGDVKKHLVLVASDGERTTMPAGIGSSVRGEKRAVH
jgi:hypothetical protein